jgi:hypothetical protein
MWAYPDFPVARFVTRWCRFVIARPTVTIADKRMKEGAKAMLTASLVWGVLVAMVAMSNHGK